MLLVKSCWLSWIKFEFKNSVCWDGDGVSDYVFCYVGREPKQSLKWTGSYMTVWLEDGWCLGRVGANFQWCYGFISLLCKCLRTFVSLFTETTISGIVLASVGVAWSICVDYTAKSVWGILSRRIRWLPTFSSPSSSLSHSFLLSPFFLNYPAIMIQN